MLCAVLGFTSCEDEKKPVFEKASSDSFEVYEPAFQNQYYELTENGTLEIVCKSAPNYGAPIGPTTYGALLSLTPDFTNTVEISAENNASRVMLREQEIAQGICTLMGLTKDDAGYVFENTVKIYLKATCRIAAIEDSYVVSKNYCTFNNVMPYFAIPSPAFIYLVGAPEGWLGPSAGNAAHYEEWRLFEKDDEIGSNVYYGTFEVPAGSAMFRFYTQMLNWDDGSYGPAADDNPVACEFDGDTYNGPLVPGKGSYNFESWPGGKMLMKVDMNKPMSVEFTAVD